MICSSRGMHYLNRIYLCLGMALILPGIAFAQETTKRCQYDLAQTLPIHFNGTQPTIEAGINGKTVKMLIDSGSFTTSLFRHAADRLELPLRHSPFTTIGVGGESGTYLARIKEARFGDSIGKSIEFPVIQTYAEGFEEDGVVGAEFLFQRSDMEISLVGRYLKFYKSSGCKNSLLSYWDHNAEMVKFRQGTEQDPRPEIDVFINGKKMRALIDTGASSSLIDLHAAETLGVTPSSPNVVKAEHEVSGIGKHKSEAWIAPFESIEIGDEMIKNPRIRISDMWSGTRKDVKQFGLNSWISERPQVILGIDFLRAHRILFSLEQNVMYFTYLGGSVFRTSAKDDISWFETAATHGDVDAQVNIGIFYLHGADGKRDVVKASDLFAKAAEKGSNRAHIELGLLYESGEGVGKNLSRAAEFYRKAAEAGDVAGQLNLARMYEHGLGLGMDQAQALHWYRKAADQENQHAQVKVGMAYLFGKGVEKDDAVASKWLDKASKEGRPGGYYRNLGLSLFNGGVYDRSESAFRKAVGKSPTDDYAALWLYLVQARFGNEEGAARQLEENKSKWQPKRVWPATIADFYLGRITLDQFMKLAHHADTTIDNEQTCEANFYGAEWHLIAHNPKEARPLLRLAVQFCPRNFVEYGAALAQLERLEAK